MRLSLLLIFVGLLLSDCSDNPSQSTSGQIKAEVSDENLRILNNSMTTIYYFAADQDFMATANWAPTSSEENAIRPQEAKNLPLSEIVYHQPGNEIILYYWTSVNPGQDEINTILITP